jgi:hypothetical protein
MVIVGVTLINFGMRMLGNCPMGNPESKCENKIDHTETAYYGDELVVVATISLSKKVCSSAHTAFLVFSLSSDFKIISMSLMQ